MVHLFEPQPPVDVRSDLFSVSSPRGFYARTPNARSGPSPQRLALPQGAQAGSAMTEGLRGLSLRRFGWVQNKPSGYGPHKKWVYVSTGIHSGYLFFLTHSLDQTLVPENGLAPGGLDLFIFPGNLPMQALQKGRRTPIQTAKREAETQLLWPYSSEQPLKSTGENIGIPSICIPSNQ